MLNIKGTFIIAEAGVNHNGDINLAKKLIDVAADSGANAVKFQTFKAKNIVSIHAEKANYQKETTGAEETQLQMIQKLELDYSAHRELINYCNKKEILFLSSPFDIESIRLLYDLGLPIFKIPSGEITNLPYLEEIGKYNKKVILSTGMATLDEVQKTLDILIKSGTVKKNITILQCNTEYPTPYADVNLRAMLTMKETFDVEVGYSDHTKGIEVPIAAVTLGAKVIEKHFTLDKKMTGPDHRASLEPFELKAMVSAIRNIEQALGHGRKEPSGSEIKNMKVARKSIVAKTHIKKGDSYTSQNITVKRPGTGISPMKWYQVIGEIAKQDLSPDELIEL
ncbi:MAG: N-acetylneuraminate synthase [Bacteroidetes bacterium GWF2_33_16]|nr:MAG: N-acetylneuraminate synthase [Bacteroidetes bacterium GWE2_32_14]OFY03400.1 MAG: N-acetylneuraminate synthase [Bacteroidetes bacterium GWF2_33_16]